MHEATVAAYLIELARKEMSSLVGEGRLVRLEMEFSELSCLNEDAFRFAFEVLSRGTCAEGAELVIERTPAILRCLDCGGESEADDLFMPCPECGSEAVVIESAGEMILRSLVVETEQGGTHGDIVRQENTCSQ